MSPIPIIIFLKKIFVTSVTKSLWNIFFLKLISPFFQSHTSKLTLFVNQIKSYISFEESIVLSTPKFDAYKDHSESAFKELSEV